MSDFSGLWYSVVCEDYGGSTFYKFRNEGLLELINDVLVMATRRRSGRDAEPTAGVIDSM